MHIIPQCCIGLIFTGAGPGKAFELKRNEGLLLKMEMGEPCLINKESICCADAPVENVNKNSAHAQKLFQFLEQTFFLVILHPFNGIV